MSTVAEIKPAVDKLSPGERAEWEALVWLDWDRAGRAREVGEGA